MDSRLILARKSVCRVMGGTPLGMNRVPMVVIPHKDPTPLRSHTLLSSRTLIPQPISNPLLLVHTRLNHTVNPLVRPHNLTYPPLPNLNLSRHLSPSLTDKPPYQYKV